MKDTTTRETARREAPDSSVRPAKSRWVEAYQTARRLKASHIMRDDAARIIATALAQFGGQVISIHTRSSCGGVS